MFEEVGGRAAEIEIRGWMFEEADGGATETGVRDHRFKVGV